ncbi:universal stress protein [Streptacidiphilus pinicola]|uniref:universal stress protein n=1 Tax=Streptacidiphilus pinicola TaxID=2219663 RepID=UPI003C78293C
MLVGYDGSTSSGRALAWAAGLARRIHQPLLVAYISAAPTPYVAAMVDPVGQEAALLDWVRKEMAEALPVTVLAGGRHARHLSDRRHRIRAGPPGG